MTTKRTTRSRQSGPRRSPERTCVVCRSPREKRALIRLALSPDGTVFVDPSGKGPGRGAYLCPDPVCWADGRLALKLGRALKTTVTGACMAMLAEYAATLPKDAGDGTTVN